MANIVATVGASNANSYCTISEAENYFLDRLHNTIWTTAEGSDKQAALIWATRLLDEICDWLGSKTGDLTQALRWPRDFIYDPDGNNHPNTSIPQFLKNATAEFAFHLLGEDRTLETNRGMMGFSEIKVDVIDLKINQSKAKKLMPPSVWTIVRPYCTYKGTGQRKTVRV